MLVFLINDLEVIKVNSQKVLEDIFRKNGIEWEIKDFDNYVNPKCKTAKSIYSKLTRLYYATDDKSVFNISNSGITDLLRMTIIVEYEDVVQTIQKLKQNFPDLSGYLKNKASGYRGIHLRLKIDGVPCEIQLAPKIVVMAVDYLHSLHVKWRDFNYRREIDLLNQREQDILKLINNQEKDELSDMLKLERKFLQNKYHEEEKDFELSKKTYDDVFDATNFSLYYDEIATAINKINEVSEKSSLLSDPKLVNIFNINLLTNGEYDQKKVKQVAELLSSSIEDIQDRFVNLVKECLLL